MYVWVNTFIIEKQARVAITTNGLIVKYSLYSNKQIGILVIQLPILIIY